MSELGEYVSQLAAKESEITPDARGTRAYVQGLIAGDAMKGFGGYLKVADVEQLVGADGDYLPYLTIVTGSGARIKITVENV